MFTAVVVVVGMVKVTAEEELPAHADDGSPPIII